MAASVESTETEAKDLGTPSEENGDAEKSGANFECNICLDTAKDAVISMCGHLFCWPCLHQWLETRVRNQTCPVCKAAISRDKVIPLYGRGSTNNQDPREKVPPRPAGQRTEPEASTGFIPGLNDGEGVQFQFGIGAFPFALFTSFNNHGFFGGGGHGAFHMPQGTNLHRAEDRTLNLVFFAMAILFLIWLLVV